MPNIFSGRLVPENIVFTGKVFKLANFEFEVNEHSAFNSHLKSSNKYRTPEINPSGLEVNLDHVWSLGAIIHEIFF